MIHTPGPWELDSAKDRDGRHFIVHGPIPTGINPDFGYPVCDTSNRHHCISPKEDAANARLIAAAPELLEALETALSAEETRLYSLPASDDYEVSVAKDGCSARIGRYRAAIAKATGGAQ